MKYDMPEVLRRQLAGRAKVSCLYCSNLPDTTEHVMPAAFGYFKNAPMLQDRLCSDCNNKRLGLLDQQLARCGVEGFFRKFYGIEGRKEHDPVNPFMRGSAGGKRIEATTFDATVGREVPLEMSLGQATQLCSMTLIEQATRKSHHIPLHPKMSAQHLRAEFDRCKFSPPLDAAFSFHPDEREWVERLVQQVWPTVTISTGTLLSSVIERPVLKFQVTDRYHRSFAKLGFHYFLSQFPRFSGHEEMFAGIRQFIAEDSDDDAQSRVDSFITERTTPLLSTVAMGLTPPDDWRAHVIAAEVRPEDCVAHVQMFITREWKPPIRTIVLARSQVFTSHEAAGHLFLYHSVDKRDGYVGEAQSLSVMAI